MTEFETETINANPGVSTLVSGIVDDAKQLIVEQMTLFQVEIKNDIRQAALGMAPLMFGILVLFVATLLFAMGTAHLASWLIPDLPLWGGFLGVGCVVALAGAGLLFWAKSMLANVNPLPETALKGLKENIQWKTKK